MCGGRHPQEHWGHWGHHEGHGGHHGMRACDCGCDGHHHGHRGRCVGEGDYGFRRRFRSREEQLADLEAYLKELEAEVQGVREAIADLRGPQPSQSQQ